jgi:hypothetical protein
LGVPLPQLEVSTKPLICIHKLHFMFEIPIFPYLGSSFIKLQLLADAHSVKSTNNVKKL